MKASYEEVVNTVRDMKCMVPCKSTKNRPDMEVFYLKGLRVFVMIRKTIRWSMNSDPEEKVEINWRVKKKNKKASYEVSFEDVLDFRIVGAKAKEELLFHLDIFGK